MTISRSRRKKQKVNGKQLYLVKYPENVIAITLSIGAEPIQPGRTYDEDKGRMRAADIRHANQKLMKNLPDGWVVDNVSGQVHINGVPHTWHHHYNKGQMQLIPTELHENAQKSRKKGGGGTHTGLRMWHVL